MLKRKFSEFYEIRQYRQHSSHQIVVKKYSMGNKRIVVDEER